MQTRASLALAIAITAIGLVSIAAPRNQSVLGAFSYDSFRYLAGAESILRDGTYRDLGGEPQRIWPPGTSLLYAGVSRVTGIAPEKLVSVINGLSYAITALLLWLLTRVAGMRWWTAGLMLAAFLLNSAVLAAHRKLWSEPPALALLAAVLFCVVAAKRDRTLALAVLFASMAIVFRFALLATVPFLCVAFAVRTRRKVLALLPLLAPLPSWLAARMLGAGATGDRARGFHPAAWAENYPAILSLADQLFPARLLGMFAIIAMIAFVVFGAVLARRPLTLIAAAWVACYGGFLLFAQAVATPSFTLDLRILLPMYLGMVTAIASAADALAVTGPRRLGAAVLALPLLLVLPRSARTFLTPQPEPPCFNRAQYIAALRGHQFDGPIATNAAGTVWFATRQRIAAGGTPVWLDPAGACANVIEDPAPPPPGAIIIRATR